eukprot:m.10997 g.10997  ORF g.10997 m.10997 type:complete len:302 (-) comp5714_c0_seq2:141-1046(-)
MAASQSSVVPVPPPPSFIKHFVSGYFSGCALVLAGHPFDTIKVRLQTDSARRFRGPWHCLVETVRGEGLRAVYKGITPPLLATGIINSLLFGMQGWFTHNIASARGHQPTQPHISDICAAALCSGLAISIVVAPVEGIKARLQVDYTLRGQGPIACARRVVSTLGVRNGLYRGWLPTALCRMSNYAYFGPYEYIRRLVSPVGPDGKPQRTLPASIAAGGLTGVCYWLSCYPIDVIKNRLQAAPDRSPPVYRGMVDAARAIHAEAGVRGFFRGFVPCILRAFPANASCFVAFEIAMRFLPFA